MPRRKWSLRFRLFNISNNNHSLISYGSKVRIFFDSRKKNFNYFSRPLKQYFNQRPNDLAKIQHLN